MLCDVKNFCQSFPVMFHKWEVSGPFIEAVMSHAELKLRDKP